MPGGVPPEGCLVLAGCTLTVDLVLHHGYAVELRAAPERVEGKQRRLKATQGNKMATVTS